MYELLILTKEWFLANPRPGKFRVLSQILNKGYSKPMEKYGIIESPRIKHDGSLLECLQLKPGKEFAIMVLLGSEADFQRLEKRGYVRDFQSDIWPLSRSGDCDIPAEFSTEFGPLDKTNVRHVTLGPSDELTADVAARVLATIGLKTYDDDGHFSAADRSPHTKHYELTGFTSFMRSAGTKIMGYLEEVFLRDPGASLFKPEHVTRIVLHAVVISEHDLVPYYEKACRFVRSAHPDVVIPASATDSPLEDGIQASRDFSISFLRKDIVVGQ